jgi:biopolymer transport protein TolQ
MTLLPLSSMVVSVSVWGQIQHTGTVVLLVLLTLIGLSVVTWAIVVYKTLQLKRAQAQSDEFLDHFWEAKNFESASEAASKLPQSPVAGIFLDAFRDLKAFRKERQDVGPEDTALRELRSGTQGLQRTLQSRTITENLRLEKYLTFLATVASAAPFIGLFGTVWGIMDAFKGIGETGSASLSVVAGPISEALIATAAGLAAAIPAVVAYNYLLGLVQDLQTEMDNFSLELLNLCERYFLK